MFFPRYLRTLLAQLRFRILPLRVETGRFQNTKDPKFNQTRKLMAEESYAKIAIKMKKRMNSLQF